MATLKSRHGDFSDLEELFRILADQNIIAAHGTYDSSQPHPGPHIMFASPNSDQGYDFVKQNDGTYIVSAHQNPG
jgi:hypothetical protein